MKKVVKSIVLLSVMCAMVVFLTGCGEEKLVATKTTESSLGSYKEEVTATFKDNKVNEVTMSMEFDNEETAASMYSLYNLGMSMSDEAKPEGMNVKLDGKKLVITMDAKAYAESEGAEDSEMTKEALKASLEEAGYTVK